jgi:imidazolonepropionase-like amidohydrolase
MSDEQIRAACGEATALGLRPVVQAHASSGAKAAVLAGCTSIAIDGQSRFPAVDVERTSH